MGLALVEFARHVSAAAVERSGFEATETIQAGGIRVEARVRVRAPARIAIAYTKYQSPIAELDELLGGDAAFSAEELVGMTLIHDGAKTWHFNPKGDTALCRPGRTLYEPLPGYDALGEHGFLPDLTRDFLLRDAGEEKIHGTKTRLLGLKPKQSQSSQLLRITAFPIQRATVAFDEETGFPVRIRFTPSRHTPLLALLGSDPTVSIEYTAVRHEAPGAEVFDVVVGDDILLFEEQRVPAAEVVDALPFVLELTAVEALGYSPVDEPATIAVDRSSSRGYVVLGLSNASQQGEEVPLVTLRAGNYLSRSMARRRTLIAEHGELIEVHETPIRFLDRKSLWEERLPGVTAHAPIEATWERHGVFTVVTAEGLSQDQLVAFVSALTGSAS